MADDDASRRPGALQYIRMDRSVRDAVRLLAQPGTDALVVIDGHRPGEGAIVGLLTERDIFQALTARGFDTLDAQVWTLAQQDFVTVDVRSAPAERLATFCAHRTDRIAVTDGFALRSIQTIWDCLAARPNRMGGATP